MNSHPPHLMRRFDFERWPRPAPSDVKFFVWRLAILSGFAMPVLSFNVLVPRHRISATRIGIGGVMLRTPDRELVTRSERP